MHTIDKVDLYNTDCYMVNNNTADQIIEWVKKAEETNSLLIILFHGVGGGNSLNVAVPEHSKFLHYLKQNEKDIWIPTMMEAAEYVKKYQSEKNKMQ
jgi:sialate O-acetylesterase